MMILYTRRPIRRQTSRRLVGSSSQWHRMTTWTPAAQCPVSSSSAFSRRTWCRTASQVRVAMTTNLVSKLMRLSAPMLRDAASEKRMLCNSIVRQMRYRRRNIGSEKMRSTGMRADTGWPSDIICTGGIIYLITPVIARTIHVYYVDS